MEEGLRNGIALAKLAKFLDSSAVKKIYENRTRLHFRHTDNLNFLYNAMRKVGLPDVRCCRKDTPIHPLFFLIGS